MNRLIALTMLIFLSIPTFASCNSLRSESREFVCIFNNYSGDVLFDGKEGVSFRARTCSESRCKRWRNWDWMHKDLHWVFEYGSGGDVDVQWNADGERDIRTRRLYPTMIPNDGSCQAGNSWYFDRGKGQIIDLFAEEEHPQDAP